MKSIEYERTMRIKFNLRPLEMLAADPEPEAAVQGGGAKADVGAKASGVSSPPSLSLLDHPFDAVLIL